MNEYIKYVLIGVGIIVVAVLAYIFLIKIKNDSIKKDIKELDVKINNIKTIPLAFKLSRAQTIAKKSNKNVEQIEEYYKRYEKAETDINKLSEIMNNLEDAIALKRKNEVDELLPKVKEMVIDVEKEVRAIDNFLEKFSEKENNQREFATKLKEEYRQLKLFISNNAQSLSISYDGFEKKLVECEELFSQSEEWMYANDLTKAQESLDTISNNLHNIKVALKDMKDFIQDMKGVIPVMIDEVSRKYALQKQRGIYLYHLNIDEQLKEYKDTVTNDLKVLAKAEVENIEEHIKTIKNQLVELEGNMDKEYNAFVDVKKKNEDMRVMVASIKELNKYVCGSYDKDSQRFDLQEIKPFIEAENEKIKQYEAICSKYLMLLNANNTPSTEILKQIVPDEEEIENNRKQLMEYKKLIDKNTVDEIRAKSQLMKLQVVINDVETKVKEYHLPSIAESYESDLIASREKIKRIKELLAEVPLNIEELNTCLDDAIKFIYTFYNNANNVVSMAIMVESTIVFGNKYRSTYPDIDQELSKAEFSYLNGEYTKALKMAIASMDRLFPRKNVDQKIVENA